MTKESLFKQLYTDNFGTFVTEAKEFNNLPVPLYKVFFPDKDIIGTDWTSLIGGEKNVMATVTGVNSKAPLRGDAAIRQLSMSSLWIQHGKERSESDLIKIRNLFALNSDASRRILLEQLFGDAKFVFNGVQSRKSAISLQLLSSGKATFNLTNNPDGIKKVELDYKIPASQKQNAAVKWSLSATAKPLDDIRAAKKAMKGIQFMLMTEDTFELMRATDQLKATAANITLDSNVAVSLADFVLDLERINSILTAQRLPTVVIIDDLEKVENNAGEDVAIASWTENIVTFVKTLVQGDFNNTETIEASDPSFNKNADIAVIDKVTIIKGASIDPPSEVIIGKAIAGIDWTQASNVIILDTESA